MNQQNNIIVMVLTVVATIVVLILATLFLPFIASNKHVGSSVSDADLIGGIGDEEMVVCAADAFECPDGSFVPRIPPSCEFASCIDVQADQGSVGGSTGDVSIENPMDILSAINNYNDCVEAGFPILESMPQQCMTPDGRIFINE